MCFFKSPIITTKIGGFGRAPTFPPKSNQPSNQPSNRLQPSPTVSNRLPLPTPGTAMERLRKRWRWFFFVSPQADLRFGPRRTTRLSGGKLKACFDSLWYW